MRSIIFSFMIIFTVLLLTGCGDAASSDNLINKVNSIDDQWVNYEGQQERNNTMVQSQFIPYDSEREYLVNYPTYISYYNGDEFLETKLYDETPAIIETIEGADGVIVSFNKKNKNGMKLEKTDEH